ncbi:gamma-glutamyltransferase [bacterium]|nr:gamma-glutamyltransferase [bacterium]
MFSAIKIHFKRICVKFFNHPAALVSLLIAVCLLVSCAPKWQTTPLEPASAPVTSDNGMVVAAHPLAAEAGIAVLKDGGNAVDAALASLFMLNVVEPHASGLGGGGFALVRMADQDAKVVVYRERAPKEIDPSFYSDPLDSLQLRLHQGATSVCVPGAAAGWAEMFDNWATLPLERLARDAIDAAENGFLVDPTLSGQMTNNFDKLSADKLLANTFLKTLDLGFEPDSSADPDSLDQPVYLPYDVGDTLRQPELAATLRLIVQNGLRSFYRYPIGEAVVNAVNAGGGVMTLEDLEFYSAEITDPVKGSYSGYDILSIPPPSRGGVALIEALNLFEYTNATQFGLGDPRSIHLTSQCLQQAYTDARFMVSDPAVMKTNWRQMLTKEHTENAADGISIDAIPRVRFPVQKADKKDHGNTTHLVVVDKDGNIVSLTQSINYFFGAGVMAGNTGLLLNNQMADFTLPPTEESPLPVDTLNYLTGRKRPRSNMTPLIMLKDGQPVLVVGTPGGSRIVAAMVQIVVNMVDYDLDISAAIDYPRYFPVMEHLVLENRIDIKTLKALKKIGYELHPTGPYSTYFGGAHGITLPPLCDKISGAADKRRGGAARGY